VTKTSKSGSGNVLQLCDGRHAAIGQPLTFLPACATIERRSPVGERDVMVPDLVVIRAADVVCPSQGMATEPCLQQ
jgi:hypothetical protein